MTHTRDIPQSFWRDEQLTWLELRSTWRSHQAYKCHHHPQLSIGAILEGETCCVSHGKEYHLQVGDLIVIPPQVPHSCNPVNGQFRSYHMLYLDADWCLAQLPERVPHTPLFAPNPVIRNPQHFQHFLDLVALMETRQTEPLVDAARLLLRALPLQSGNPQRPRATSQSLKARLQCNLLSPPSLDDVAQEFGMRKETLIRTFKQDTGLTPGSYLNIARIDFARTRLRAGDDIADVGYQSGFADQSHFHRTFVSYTAATPRQYARGRSISDNN
ncbi:AraC family transcriptional regulator [Citrobacter farmeri]|uniref:helix-turn-helix domain-containing protein n=1 Tax=Citrobacter farmeri TaxID=67824 RepID=UPI0019069C31|nr:AraC family transcriptional regulator [Citrobacter farmeri]MBJ9162973.1 AraC family transcriptional regulator [Citrobacter farmeri]